MALQESRRREPLRQPVFGQADGPLNGRRARLALVDLRIRDAIAYCRAMRVRCHICGHRGRVDPNMLSIIWGPATRMRALAPRCRCSRCSAHMADFEYTFREDVELR